MDGLGVLQATTTYSSAAYSMTKRKEKDQHTTSSLSVARQWAEGLGGRPVEGMGVQSAGRESQQQASSVLNRGG